jgi:hypothetical protein
MISDKLSYQVFADYFQFSLEDENREFDELPYWDDATIERMLIVQPGCVYVGTARNMTVPVEVEILDQAPPLDIQQWDKVNECSLEIASGRLVVLGNDYYPEAPRIDVAPGLYHVRLLYAGLDTLDESGLEGDDHYHVQLWPTNKAMPVTVVK